MRKQAKNLLFFIALCAVMVMLSFSVLANGYVEDDTSYTVYNDTQYTEVITGVYNGTLANKKIVFGCDIETVTDFVMTEPCDITIDLNGFTYKNNKTYNKSGDFDFQNRDAILRISNGYIDSSFCVFIFRTSGQLYAENITVSSNDECIYHYGSGHSAVVSLKNCKMDARGNFTSVTLGGDCGGGNNGTLYMIEGGEYAGLNILCPKEGSYIKDCRVYEKRLTLDTWHKHGGNNDKNVILEIRNVNVEQGEIYLNDVSLEPVLYDCQYTTINLSNKSGAVIVAYTSPTCTEPGTKTTYHHLTDITVDEEYPINNPALGHTLDLAKAENIIYDNFMGYGKHITGCKECGVTGLTEVDGTAQPLFYSEGYSVPEDGSAELVISFYANKNAIEKYESVTNKKVSYGIFAVAQKNLGAGDILNQDGSAVNGAIKADVSREFASVELRIFGFVTEAQKSAKLALGAYVCEKLEENESYSFVQYGTPAENEKYSFISYSDVVNQQIS